MEQSCISTRPASGRWTGPQRANELAQVYTAYPAMWDGTMSAAQRYQIAAERYGDQLFAEGQDCDAVKQYQAAQGIGNMDQTAAKGLQPGIPEMLSANCRACSTRCACCAYTLTNACSFLVGLLP